MNRIARLQVLLNVLTEGRDFGAEEKRGKRNAAVRKRKRLKKKGVVETPSKINYSSMRGDGRKRKRTDLLSRPVARRLVIHRKQSEGEE